MKRKQPLDSLKNEEQDKKMLRERAKALAQKPLYDKKEEHCIEILEFILAHEHYGIKVSYIREVHPLKEFTLIPCTPPFVFGIINDRGQIISIIDIKKFFNLPAKGLFDHNVIIIHNDEMEFGILADAIVGIEAIPLSTIQPSLPTLTGIREQYLKGITKDGIVILDALKLLSDKTLIIHEEVK
jgi:purine-binding chemotaxis protein CheW